MFINVRPQGLANLPWGETAPASGHPKTGVLAPLVSPHTHNGVFSAHKVTHPLIHTHVPHTHPCMPQGHRRTCLGCPSTRGCPIEPHSQTTRVLQPQGVTTGCQTASGTVTQIRSAQWGIEESQPQGTGSLLAIAPSLVSPSLHPTAGGANKPPCIRMS